MPFEPTSGRKHLRRVELVIARSAWDSALRKQIFDLDAHAVGTIQWLPVARGLRALVEDVKIEPVLAQGTARPSMDSFAVLHVEHASTAGWSAAELLSRMHLQADQNGAAIVVYPGSPSRWDGMLQLAGESVVPIDCLRVVGPAPMILERQLSSTKTTNIHEDELYSRQIGVITERAFRVVKNAHITQFGGGRLGLLVSSMFAAIGVAGLRTIDQDRLELHNLDGGIGLSVRDVGRPKVEAVARSLLRFRPELLLSCFKRPITDVKVREDVRRMHSDLFVSTVDNDTARFIGWLLAKETLSPSLDVATTIRRNAEGLIEMVGDVRLLLPGRGQGCPACVGGLANEADTLYQLAAPPRALVRGPSRPWNESRLGSLITLNSIAAGAAVQMWLDLVRGKLWTSAWQRLRWTAETGLVADFAPVASAPNCRFCFRRN